MLKTTTLTLANLAIAASLHAQPCTGQWLPGGPADGLNGSVYAMTQWDPDGAGPQSPLLVIGGVFSRAGSLVVNSVAAWDGQSWRALGSGITLPGGSPVVYALAVYNGDLIAAGSFSSAGGVPCSNIARWDGAAWNPLSSWTSAEVDALTVYNGSLIAGGGFEQIGGINSWKTAAWDGAAWHAMGRRQPGYTYALAVFNGQLYAGGSYSGSSIYDAEGPIARWTGATWVPVGAGIVEPTARPIVKSLSVFNGELMVGGTFTTAGDAPALGIAAWNGASWRGIDSPIAFGRAFAAFDGALVAAGSTGSEAAHFIGRWDGQSWSGLSSGMDGRVFALQTYHGVVFAGGEFVHAGGHVSRYLSRWTVPSSDFNHDGDPATDADIADFFACLAGNCCPSCNSADFNADGDTATDADIEAFFRVLAGGPC